MEAKFDPKAWAALSVTECIGIDYKQFAIPAPAALTGGASTEPSTGAGGAGAGAAAVEFPLTLGCGAVLVRLEGAVGAQRRGSRVTRRLTCFHGSPQT